jgi:hypothetical protein
MSESTKLLEASFADAVTAIEQSPGLPEQKRRHWVCSLRQVAKWLDRPAVVIPARWTSIRISVSQLHHVRLGVTAKTLANHRSNVRAALRWFGHDVPVHGVPLSTQWMTLRDNICDRGQRRRLYALMRYCSGRGIQPGTVDDTVLDAYFHYRAETTNLTSNNTARRSMARTWNVCGDAVDGWPTLHLTEPPIKAKEGPSWEDFPEGLRRDMEGYLQGLSKLRRHSFSGKRIRPCQPRTVRTRRAELVAVARMAVRLGVPIESLTRLSALVHPDVVERVIEAYWAKNGKEPKVFTIDLGWKLLRIARELGCFNQQAIERLDEIRFELEQYRHSGLTEKNLLPAAPGRLSVMNG